MTPEEIATDIVKSWRMLANENQTDDNLRGMIRNAIDCNVRRVDKAIAEEREEWRGVLLSSCQH